MPKQRDRNRRNVQDYANEKLGDVIRVLATHEGNARVRLRFAAEHIVRVPASALPERLRVKFAAIMADLTKYAPDPEYARSKDNPRGRTRLTETLGRIRVATAADIADRLYQLASELDHNLSRTKNDLR